jgi:hypothetical protein
MNWTKSNSFKLSLILVEVTFLLLIGMLFLIPAAVCWYDAVSGLEPVKYFLGTILYISDLIAFVVIGALYRLLRNIEKHLVFIDQNATYLRIISWGLVAVSVLLLIFSFKRGTALILAFVMAFLGLILRVLKNVFEEAIALQNEQDFTI